MTSSSAVGAGAVALGVLLIYLFSFPLAVRLHVAYRPYVSAEYLVGFYDPALTLAQRCPPYLAVLEYETQLLGVGIHYTPLPSSHP